MQEKNPTKKYLIISIIVFVACLSLAMIGLFLVKKEQQKTATLSDDLSIATREDVVALKRAIRSYEESADTIKGLLVNKDNIFEFISEVENLAKQDGAIVSVQNIDLFDVVAGGEMVRNTGVENTERTHGKFLMNVRVDGNWDSVSNFLLKMESFPKHTSIEAVRISSVFDSQTKKQTWSANFNIITTTN